MPSCGHDRKYTCKLSCDFNHKPATATKTKQSLFHGYDSALLEVEALLSGIRNSTQWLLAPPSPPCRPPPVVLHEGLKAISWWSCTIVTPQPSEASESGTTPRLLQRGDADATWQPNGKVLGTLKEIDPSAGKLKASSWIKYNWREDGTNSSAAHHLPFSLATGGDPSSFLSSLVDISSALFLKMTRVTDEVAGLFRDNLFLM